MDRPRRLVSLLCGFAFAACAIPPPNPPGGPPLADPELPPAEIPAAAMLDQGWNASIRKQWWFTSQGSDVVHYDWLIALEEKGSQAPFARAEKMEALGFITLGKSDINPHGLPIGFARNNRTGWVGFTCAACHTGRIDYGDEWYLVEGGPALVNFDRFLVEINDALEETLADPAKFERFAKRVLGRDYGGANKRNARKLRDAVNERWQELEAKEATAALPPERYPADYPGFGRIDAYTHIYNQVTSVALGDPDNKALPNGPASIPFLWGAPQSNRVQWNAAARNRSDPPKKTELGPLARNVVEVIGVYGRLDIDPAAWWEFWRLGPRRAYASSIDMQNLGSLEHLVWYLRSPPWPFDEPDPVLVKRGEREYEKRCNGCHPRVLREHQGDDYEATLVDLDVVGTDQAYARNARERVSRTLELDGRPRRVFRMLGGGKFGPVEPTSDMVYHAALGAILRHPLEAWRGFKRGQGPGPGLELQEFPGLVPIAEGADRRSETRLLHDAITQDAGPEMPLVYKARPLTGIWATAPYLHNGSVPTLKQMLDPSQREERFCVGSRTFDPVEVGFEHQLSGKDCGPDQSLFDTRNHGNSNQGHDFARDPAEREALLEFLKTL